MERDEFLLFSDELASILAMPAAVLVTIQISGDYQGTNLDRR